MISAVRPNRVGIEAATWKACFWISMSPDTVVPSSLRDPERPSALPELPSALVFTEPLTATSKWTVCTAVRPVTLRVMISFGSETGAAVGVPELLPQPTTASAKRTPEKTRAGLLVVIKMSPPCGCLVDQTLMADEDQVKRVGRYPRSRGRPEVGRTPEPSWPGVPGCLQERPEARVPRSWY